MLAGIERASFSDPWSVQSFHRLLTASHAIVTVLELPSGEVAGFTVLLHAADEAELANIAVASPHRGQGFGRTLLAHAIAQAQAVGATAIFLEVRPSNASALALYVAAGFSEVGRRRRYYVSPTEDAIVLARVM
jgi:ribosomal-protein-alanine N-acetyltransferase